MAAGVVKWFNDKKGFGFITPEIGGADVFVHHTAIVANGFRSLTKGDRVEFDSEAVPKGLMASKVMVVGAAAGANERSQRKTTNSQSKNVEQPPEHRAWLEWTAELMSDTEVTDVCWKPVENTPGRLVLEDPSAEKTVAIQAMRASGPFRSTTKVAKELKCLAERWQDDRIVQTRRAQKSSRLDASVSSANAGTGFDPSVLHLVDFGWHAPHSVDSRRAALSSAVTELGVNAVLMRLQGCRVTNWYPIHWRAVEDDVRFVAESNFVVGRFDSYIFV